MISKSSRYLLGERFVFSPNDTSLVDLHEEDELIRLGSNECRVLMVLIEEPHAIVTRHRIHDYVWRKQGVEVDDSSLTQSISTLRKALKDTTKNPMFVKTVPKRGYQVVCSVESYNDQTAELLTPVIPVKPTFTQDIQPTEPTKTSVNIVEDTSISKSNPLGVIPTVTDTQTPSLNIRPIKTPLCSWLALIFAFLIPILFYLTSTPKSEAFREIFRVQDISVSIPVNNARIEQWQPMVERCVLKYLEYYGKSRTLREVIVSGGQNNQISLNYIHNDADKNKNKTYVLLTRQEESHSLCR